jgi:lipopolysaccharide heptosyltransferase III
MAPRPSSARRVRKRVNRRLYRSLYGLYRALFPTSARAERPSPSTVRRLLVIQHYGVGDMVLTTPLLSYLKDQAPQAEIDVLASSRNAAVVAGDSCVTRVYVHDHTWRGWSQLLRRLRARRYDLIFSGQAGRNLREGLAASAIARRDTYKVSLWRPKRYHGLFTLVVRVPPSISHTRDRLIYMAQRAFGLAPLARADQYSPRIARDATAEAAADQFRASHGLRAYAVVNLSAHFAVRDWAPEPCAQFLALLLARHPELSVVLTRPRGKEAPAEETARRCNSPRVLVAPAMPLLGVAALIRGSVGVITPDTAIVHVASACRRPVVALYAPVVPTDVTRWLPVGVPYRALVADLGGSMSDIEPERIADAFDELQREAESPSETVAAGSAER